MNFLLTAAFLVAVSPSAFFAYEQQFADNAHRFPLKWKNGVVTISLSNSLKQAANIKPGSDVPGAIERSLATWERAANLKINTVWTEKQAINAAGSAGDGTSLLTIAAVPENLASFAGDATELAGRTRVFYTRRGQITEADIALNPFQQFSTDGAAGTYDLQATITHEIGHLLGLDHSGVLGVTMHPQQGKNGTYSLPGFAPRTLGEDDRAAIRSIYGTRKENCCGTISGTLTASDGKPLANLVVWAENETDGRLIAAVKTNSTGAYQIGGLQAGKYRVLAQTLDNENRGTAAKIGSVAVESEAAANLNRALNFQGKALDFRLIGFNSQLSTVAVPLNAGRSYMIFAGGNFVFDDLAGIETSSQLLTINADSVSPQNFGADVSVLSFQVDVEENAPKGEYSLILRKKSGEIVYLLGALTIDDVPNDFQSHFLGE